METFDALHALRTFRYSLYECLHRRTDALFELTDAILTADAVPSPVHLSLAKPRIVAAGAAFTPRWTEGGSTLKLCGNCSPAISLLEAQRPSTPWT
jgi:hypothetical protein